MSEILNQADSFIFDWGPSFTTKGELLFGTALFSIVIQAAFTIIVSNPGLIAQEEACPVKSYSFLPSGFDNS
jgi:hypothetical protein